jgi:hypothetical protein
MAAGGDLPRLANLEYRVVLQFEFVRRLSLRPWRILGVLCGSKTFKPQSAQSPQSTKTIEMLKLHRYQISLAFALAAALC